MLALVGAAGAGGVGSAPQDGQQKRSLLDMDDLSAATWLAELAATGGARLRKTESQHARAANHGQEQTQHSNKCSNVGKANIDLVRQVGPYNSCTCARYAHALAAILLIFSLAEN